MKSNPSNSLIVTDTGGSDALEVSNITQLVIFVNQPAQDHSFEISEIQAAGNHTPPTASVNALPSRAPS